MTTILVMILVLIVISLALSVMTLAALGDLISRLVADAVKRDARARAFVPQTDNDVHVQSVTFYPRYDA